VLIIDYDNILANANPTDMPSSTAWNEKLQTQEEWWNPMFTLSRGCQFQL